MIGQMEGFVDPYLEIKIQKVLRYLPCSDCGDCEAKECFAFAKAFINNSSMICPQLTPYEHELLFLLINYEDFLYPVVRKYIKEKDTKTSAMIGIISVGTPDKNAPIVFTSNSLYEQSILNSLLETARISCYLLAVNTHGISTGEALLKQGFSIYTIKQTLDEFHADELVNHRFIILPVFATYLKKSFEKVTNWKIIPGPVHVGELPLFIERKWYGHLFKLKFADIQRIMKLMPEQKNCGQCGYSNCFDFLLDLQKLKVDVSKCPILETPPYEYLRSWLKSRFLPVKKFETGIAIDSTRCAGCGICAKVCPANQSFSENLNPDQLIPLFKIINGTANILNYGECWRQKYLIPCQICKDNCPFEAISFGPIPIYYKPTQAAVKTS